MPMSRWLQCAGVTFVFFLSCYQSAAERRQCQSSLDTEETDLLHPSEGLFERKHSLLGGYDEAPSSMIGYHLKLRRVMVVCALVLVGFPLFCYMAGLMCYRAHLFHDSRYARPSAKQDVDGDDQETNVVSEADGASSESEARLEPRIQRRRTDSVFQLIFQAVFVVAVLAWIYGAVNGHTGRLLGKLDSKFRRCGVDPGVINKPLWFRCPINKYVIHDMDLCLSQCPEFPEDVEKCFGSYSFEGEWRRPVRFGMICAKSGARYIQFAKAWLPLNIDSFSDFVAARFTLMFLFVSSMLLSYIALILCRSCAWFAAVFVTFLMIAVPVILGAGSWINAESMGYPGVLKGLAILCFLLALWAAIASWYYWQSTIELVVVCIKSASDTIFQMPVLVFVTLWKALSSVALIIVVMYGVAMFHTSGEDKTPNEFLGGSRDRLPVTVVHLLISIWIVSVNVSLTKFSCFYSVAEFYYAPWSSDGKQKMLDRKYWLPLRAYFVGAYFHIGSLALGSVCTWAQKIVFFVNMVISCVLKCISCLPFCCVDCSRFVSKRKAIFQGDLAYLYIAMNSKDYCSASYSVSHQSDEMRFVSQIVFAFSFTCSITIALVNAVVVHWIIHGAKCKDASTCAF
eukprot:TRINITY_DN30076_c0_g1_i2.p1 TRINITY_DN30076_c0_g1~~TRINITY_DN30076_c0_g1_i2.p1  ORF type:complete len:625 (+),score=39.46 TRINITY_DN30076_c0_g1_i2:52-1926(+)